MNELVGAGSCRPSGVSLGASNEDDPSGRCVNTGSPAGASPSIRCNGEDYPKMLPNFPPARGL